MAKTVVGLFSSVAKAEEVKQALIAEDYVSGKISVVANGTEHTEKESGVKQVGEKISSFFKSLTGGDEDAHEHYATGVNGGGALLAATVEDDEATEVTAFLKAHGARDIDGSREAAEAGTPVYGGSATGQEGMAIPIIEESLVVGKREVDRGGVRVYSHVVERPVAADVTLRDEVINVERRYVDRPATTADFAAGSGQVIELTATGEEAVVGKTSRVVEEVHVGKQSTERNEQISDSVRKTEVHVEEVAAVAGGLKDDRY